MRHFRLTTLLIFLNVGLLLLAVAGVAGSAAVLLRRFADEQALAYVAQAGVIAGQEIERRASELLTNAEVLAERPTLLTLAQQHNRPALSAYLDRYHETSRLSGAAVVEDGQLLAASGAIALDTLPTEGTVVLRPGLAGKPPQLVAVVAIPELPGGKVALALALDQPHTEQIGTLVGLPIALRAVSTPESALHTQRLEAPMRYVATAPLRIAGQAVPWAIEVTLTPERTEQSLRNLLQLLVLIALGVLACAGLASLAVGRRLSRPLHRLARAAAEIGAGDMITPVPVAAGGEVGMLASSLEEMRERLLRLTTDLRQQQAEAEAIVTGIVEGVFMVDRERRIRYLNRQAATALGIAPESALGKFCGDVLNPQGPGERPCRDHCPILHARFNPGARATEHLLLASGQHLTVVITSAAPTAGRQVQVLRDETELETVRRLRDVVLANISHEFRTPLSAQLASIELLLERLPELTTEQVAQLVRAQQRGALRLTRLIDNLLESVRIEAGQGRIRRRLVALDEVVEEAVELTRPLLNQRRQEAIVELPYPLPSIMGDGPRLTQVFVNLLANANKFGPIGVPIQIGGVVHADSIVLWVRDYGPGLPDAVGATGGQQTALFDRFVRAAGQEPAQSGMGLGLWIVKSIVERHNGSVGARHDADGTQFYIVLPLSQELADEDPGD